MPFFISGVKFEECLYHPQRSKLYLMYPQSKGKSEPCSILIDGPITIIWDITSFQPSLLKLFKHKTVNAKVVFEKRQVGEEITMVPRFIYKDKKWYCNTRS